MTFDDMSPIFRPERPFAHKLRAFDRETMAPSPAGSYHGLWRTDALDPVHLRDPDITGDAAMYWVGGVRRPQPEKFPYFGGDFFVCIILLENQ